MEMQFSFSLSLSWSCSVEPAILLSLTAIFSQLTLLGAEVLLPLDDAKPLTSTKWKVPFYYTGIKNHFLEAFKLIHQYSTSKGLQTRMLVPTSTLSPTPYHHLFN